MKTKQWPTDDMQLEKEFLLQSLFLTLIVKTFVFFQTKRLFLIHRRNY